MDVPTGRAPWAKPPNAQPATSLPSTGRAPLAKGPAPMSKPPVVEPTSTSLEMKEGVLTRCVLNEIDMAMWTESEAYAQLVGFITVLSKHACGSSMTDAAVDCQAVGSPQVKEMLGLLEAVGALLDDAPPVVQDQRFGNTAFRSWYAMVTARSEELLDPLWKAHQSKRLKEEQAPPQNQDGAGDGRPPVWGEVKGYLLGSFGNPGRLDYGTGHEFAFLAMLCSLCILKVFEEEDYKFIVLVIFPKYIALCRKIQRRYMLEPAGSRGVWGLDDYQFLPFIWGASQLEGHPHIKPKSFIKPDIYETFDKQYMFLGCIRFITEVKTGGAFGEHSPMLWDISVVPTWTKVNTGLFKMYKVEVLNKFPVMQHFQFGTLLPPTKAPQPLSRPQPTASQ